jgi:hypothetical protein
MPARTDCVSELTVQEFMLSALAGAEAGLRRRSVDELESLLEYCFTIPRHQWPVEVARFIEARLLAPAKMRAKVRRRVEWTRLPRGRLRSKKADLERFYRDPNRIAAHLAAHYAAKFRGRPRKSKRQPYKIQLGDKLTTVHDAAVNAAAAVVDVSLRLAGKHRRVNVGVVKELLRRGRTRRPID